ncbi:hypothetical protein SI65_02340 [Aspergillus cristatus]|uniref:Protein DSF2 n=1 Tax=Aspergillus cristatus TaxID=573508 RepID=A0A1E3BM75_ASPCR|nr:hypothetical protein SI65_02340 [Aspergillus cristatus]
MPLREILQKKDDIHYTTNGQYATGMSAPMSSPGPAVPEIRFVASDTTTSDEVITSPVVFDEDDYDRRLDPSRPSSASSSSPRKSMKFLRRLSRSPSNESSTEGATLASPTSPTGRPRRLSQLLHLDRSGSRSPSPVSAHIPADLPQIDDGMGDAQDREAQWEKRATVLVQNPRFGGGLSPSSSFYGDQSGSSLGSGSGTRSRSSSRGAVDSSGDVDIQEAIHLHEAGELEASTKMFGQLADPNGANHALSQVLYGLALRHGWGCPQDPSRAITYLSAAASNSASIESEALQAGYKKGGAAKGELVLAIFELANCFRNGWGVAKDPVAARQYFETAANLGDTDAMNEAAWCYLEGFGGKKDKFAAAKYYRLAESKGNKLVGNSWYVRSFPSRSPSLS